MVRLGSWTEQAWCRSVPALPWIAEPEDVSPAAEVAMTAVCAACPVVFECQEYVGCAGITGGFWAGAHCTPGEESRLGGVA